MRGGSGGGKLSNFPPCHLPLPLQPFHPPGHRHHNKNRLADLNDALQNQTTTYTNFPKKRKGKKNKKQKKRKEERKF